MNARSALFDLFGDHLRARGGQAPVAALVRLLAPLGVAAPAVRTAVSRMVRQGWLEPVRLPGGAGYALTPRAVRRLDDASARIYRTQDAPWDGSWHLVVTTLPTERSRRDRLRAGLTFLGFAQLDDATWLGPHWSSEVDELLESEGVRAERFVARPRRGLGRAGPPGLGRRGAGPRVLPVAVRRRVAGGGRRRGARRRARLRDPVAGWCTSGASSSSWTRVCRASCCRQTGPVTGPPTFFDAESERLQAAARRFVDRCLTSPT